jgi:RHS repeat-associated protein
MHARMRRLAKLALFAAGLLLSEPALASSGLEPTHISLPSGPGSIEGLGRTFAPSLASGTASYGVDIAVPPSAGGFEPHLSLDYDSSGGVTDVGMGWRLAGIPTIRRRTEDGLPQFNASDPMEIAGEGIPCDLLQVSPGTFRPQWESGAFVRVQQSGAGTWQARDKAGVTWNFGGTGFEEAEGAHVATYLPSEAIDLHGHKIAYQWDASSGYALLQRVVWNDFGDSARNEILVSYEARPDAHVLFQNGIEQTLTRRMTAIEVRHGGALVRRYELTYGTDVHSRLATVTMVGRDGTSRLPTLSLAYTTQTLHPTTVAMQNAPGRTPGDPNVEIGDLDGDGLPDLLVTLAGQYSSFQNQDGQSWQSEVDWDPAQSPSLALGQIGVQLADLDGDGAIDLVAKSGTDDFRYFPGHTLTTFRAPVPIATVPNFTFEDPDTKLADMDGDRLIDVVITTADGIAIGYNRGGVDWTVPAIVGQVDPTQALRFSDGGLTQLCDVNGDRVEDFCYLTPGSLVYWLGRGRGVFQPAVVATGVPAFDPSSPWELHDLNGDGWVDLVHVDPDQIEVALAHAAGQFDAPQTFTDVPSKGPNTTIRYADMNGSGTTDIVWIDVSGGATQAWQYVELFPAGRAGLLNHVDNGLGKVTTMTYRPAALDAAAARTAGTPWTSRMNVPMSVVGTVKVDDSLGDPVMETDYDYDGGTWSPVERTFAGFAGGTDHELGDAYTPTLVTTSTFDVGLVDRTLRGSVLTTQTGDTSGTIFSATTTTWTTRALQTGMDGRTVNYSFKTSEQTQHIEGTDPSQARVTLVEWDQDAWGNTVHESNWGEVVGSNKLAGHDEAITIRTFANDTDDWILGRLASEELHDAAGNRVRRKEQYYDGAAFQGLPLGQVTRGDLARETEWVGPDPSAFELDVATAYDADGNPIETRDARGGGHLMAWDPTDHTTLLSETVKLGGETLTESVVTDAAFGTIMSVTPYDGQVSSFTFDAFGRVLTIAKPGDTDDQPTIRFAYTATAPLSNVTAQRRIWVGRSNVEAVTSYFDGLGRKRVVLEAVENGKTVVSGVGLLDARGEVRRTLRPWFATSATSSPPLTGNGPGTDAWRDAMGRAVATRSQLGLTTRTAYLPLVTEHWDGAQSDPASPYEHSPHTESYDGLERVVSTTDVLEGKPLQATFTYDAAGELLSRTDPEGNTARYAYDGRGRRTDVRDPDAGHHTYTYDATGDLLTHLHPDGETNAFTYDLAGRTLTEDWDGNGNPEVVRAWDHAVQGADSALYLGRLAGVTDASGSTRYEYDARGRQSVVHHDVNGATYDVNVGYDDQDRVYWRKFPDGSSIGINRDARGAIVGYGDAVTITWDADGTELQRSFNTGVVQLYGYDADRRPTESLARDANGGEITHLKWTLDGNSNILAVSDLRAGIGPDRNRSESYRLDNLYRLGSVSGTWGSSSWGYSSSGNTLTRTTQGASVAATYGQGAGPHALTALGGRTIRYDAAGRMLDDGKRRYTWNAVDQLVDVRGADGSDVQSTFDADGVRRLRVEVSPSGQTTQTVFIDPWCEVQNGQLIRYLVHEGRRIARLASNTGAPTAAGRGCSASGSTDVGLGATLALLVGLALIQARRSRRVRWFGAAALSLAAIALIGCGSGPQGPPPVLQGTIQQLSGADELLFDDALGSATEQVDGTGRPKSTFAAFPYGVTRYDTSSEIRKYANSPRDTSVGLDQMGARAYAPDLGTWTSTDPLAVESPRELVGRSFASGNAYAYAGLNPVGRVDHDGHTDDVAPVLVAAGGGLSLTEMLTAAGGTVMGFFASPAVLLATIVSAPVLIAHACGPDPINSPTDPTNTVAPVASLQPALLPPPPQLAVQAPRTVPQPSMVAAPPATLAAQATPGPKSVKKIAPEKIAAPPGSRGRAPIGVDGKPVEIHHAGQVPYGDAEEMTATEHRGKGNYKKNHPNGNAPSKIDRQEFEKWKQEYWGKEWDSGRFEDLPSQPPNVIKS